MNQKKRIYDSELDEFVFAAPSKIHGTGLFAKRKISEGEYIGTFHGSEVDDEHHHVLWVETDEETGEQMGIQGENLLRFINHDSAGNVEFKGLDLYAITNIPQSTELTLDYGEGWDIEDES